MHKYGFILSMFFVLVAAVIFISGCGAEERVMTPSELAAHTPAPTTSPTTSPTPTPTVTTLIKADISFAVNAMNTTVKPPVPINGITMTLRSLSDDYIYSRNSLTDAKGNVVFTIGAVPENTIFRLSGFHSTYTIPDVDYTLDHDGLLKPLNPPASVTSTDNGKDISYSTIPVYNVTLINGQIDTAATTSNIVN